MISNLSHYYIKSPTTYGSRNLNNITVITIHHAAGVASGVVIANNLSLPSRNASANYCIGVDGDIVCSLTEDYSPCTSSNRNNDVKAITIECSNSEYGGDWKISDKTYWSLIDLCVDICLRYNIHMVKGESLTWHSMFSTTECPGKYLLSKFDDICEEVNRKVNEIYRKIKELSENLVSLEEELQEIKKAISAPLINNDEDVEKSKLGKDSVDAIHYWKNMGVFNGKTNGYGLTYDMARMLVIMYRAFNKF